MKITYTISFFRHGNTNKATPDAARRLTEEGKAQAAQRRRLLGNPSYNQCFGSPMARTHETLDILIGGNGQHETLDELMHDPATKSGKLIDTAFAKLGYATIGDYLEKSDNETKEALIAYGRNAWNTLCDRLQLDGIEFGSIVVGHAVLLGLLVMAAYPDAPLDEINALNFGECEGVKLTFEHETDICVGMEHLRD